MSKEKERIDVLLAKKGYVESREKAKRCIMAGMVLIDNKRIEKPGTKVAIDSNIRFKGDPIPYVSRGGLKLRKAFDYFEISVKDKIALDIGASTGGFTDCMLQNCAKKVFCIDVGYGQLAWKIRKDNRVVVMERTNIRYVKKDDIGLIADFATIDVSFISLKLVLPVVKDLLSNNSDIIALIKPQFEAGREKVGRKGVIRDRNVHKEVIKEIYSFCNSIGLYFYGLTYSPVKGAQGNREYLVHLRKEKDIDIDINYLINDVINKSHNEL